MWLRSRRLARRWTQEELARRLEYDVTYVRKIEWGERRPSEGLRIRLAQVLGVPVSSLPTSVPATPPTPLPEAAAPLIGRTEEVAAVTELFDQGARLVTVLGAPGIGKTRLAIALASHLDDRLPGGARFVSLVGVTEAAGVTREICRTLGLARRTADDQFDQLVDGLRSQEMLLVLDNFEQVVHAAPLVGELLNQVPTLRALVTSRQALELRSEIQYGLRPLRLPDGTEHPPDRLSEVAAVALFVARARKVRPDFGLDRDNAAAVAEICIRLQGIPLAIELAAGAAKFLTPKALLAQLGHGLDLPVAGPRDAPEHQRTIRTAIGWSFELLGHHERTLLTRLAVFAGGCTLEAATAVCQLPDEGSIDPRTGLLALAAKSLVETEIDDAGGTRFVFLEAVREFALERITSSGELEMVQRRHAAWFLTLAETSEQRLTGSEQAEALAVLEREHADLRAALRWSLEHDRRTAIRLCAALWRFWWIRGHLTEGRQWLSAALAHPLPDDVAHARALTGAGVLARTQGAYGPAVELLERGAEMSRSLEDRGGLALSLINLGIVAEQQGEHASAATIFEEARDLFGAMGDRRGVGHALNCLATVRLGEDDLDASVAFYEEALGIFRELSDDWSVAMVLANLGWVAQKQGRSAVARSLYKRGITMHRMLGDDRGVANMLLNLGIATQRSDREDDVAGLFEEALLIFSRLGERRGMAECLEALACTRSASDPTGAAELLGAAETLRHRIGASIWPDDQAQHARVVEAIRTELGEVCFDIAWQEGRMMASDDVVAAALKQQR